jgi:predicted O-linked N-acetylglucosamine transferase (SPINDLY family)
MSEIDYLLPNAALSPPEFECHYAETPWLLNPSACLALPDELPDVGSLPAATQGQITFGSFHSLAKISEGVLALWCSILQEVPHSKMFFKCRELVDARFREQLLSRCKKFGINEDRIVLEGATPMKEYLQAFNTIDIGLDPFPYNSGTVGFHSLLMGVPYISLKGDRMLSRIGFSNLTQVGLEELAAGDLDEYKRKAINLANDIPRLGKIRDELRKNTLESGLFDGNRMAKTLQTAFREMWSIFLTNNK